MARIKKKGLEYFPLDTDFMHHRVVRRIMKREGDRALAVLVTIFSYIYSDEGYFLRLDGQCLDDIAAYFYDLTVDDIKRIVEAAVEGGLFDEGLYEREHVLTSAHIQQQYVFSKKQSKDKLLNPDLRLLPAGKDKTEEENKEGIAENRDTKTAKSPEIGTHSIEKHSIAQQSIENPPLQSPPDGGGAKGTPDGEDGKGCAATDTGLLDLSHLSASSTRKFRFAQGEPTLPSGYLVPEVSTPEETPVENPDAAEADPPADAELSAETAAAPEAAPAAGAETPPTEEAANQETTNQG